MSRLLLPLLVFVAVAAARLPVALAHLDTHYPYELFSGNVAAALDDGLELDLAHLYVISHIRGGALFGALAWPFFELFGATALSLKLVPLLWHALTVALLVAFCRRFFGQAAALTTGLLFIAAPPLIAKLSVLGFASHLESTLLIVLAFGAFGVLTIERRHRPWRWLLFGLTVGASVAFHLQATLGALLLLGLAAIQETRAFRRGALPLLVGLTLGASPLLLFDSGGWEIAAAVSERSGDRIVAVEDGRETGAVRINGTLAKARALATGGLGPVLEFGELGPRAGATVAHVYGVGLALAAALVLLRDRRRLLALVTRLTRRAPTEVSPLAFFGLHALAIAALLVASGMTLNQWFVGSGMDGRRIAPMLFSIMVLAGVGLAPREGERRGPRLIVLALLVAAGLAGTVAASRTSEAGRLMTRGECYPWFGRQLEHLASNPARVIETILRIDRGDRRFVTLRYAPRMPVPPDAPVATAIARAARAEASLEQQLFGMTALGRAFALDQPRLTALAAATDSLERLPAAHRAALLHGVGLNVLALMPRTSQLPPELLALARLFSLRDVVEVFEGYGFAQGFVFDPYNGFHRERIVSCAGLPHRVRDAFARGFAWGLRQRWIAPPDEEPEGLVASKLIPEASRPAFVDALSGRALPAEATLLEVR